MDQQQGTLNVERSAWGNDAWQRWFWLWDLYFGASYVALVGLTLTAEDPTPTAKWTVVALISTMAVLYLAGGRRLIITDEATRRPWTGRLFIGTVVVLLATAVLVESTTSFALFAVCPLIFMSLRLREAIVLMIPVNLLPALHVAIEDGIGRVFAEVGPITLLTLLFGLLLGTWIHRIVAQSEERGKLIEELETSREEISRLSREAGVNAERSRIAAEIHDTLAQGFTSLLTLVQAAESELDRDQEADREKVRRHLRLAARTARENLGEARALVAGLMPSALGTGSLDDAIRRQLERVAEETSLRTAYQVDGDIAELPTGLEVVLLRAVQESLTNVRKHAHASRVTIRLRVDQETATLRVADDGRGFDPDLTVDGYGLRGMRARAEQVGGSLEIDGGPAGTTLTLEVPR